MTEKKLKAIEFVWTKTLIDNKKKTMNYVGLKKEKEEKEEKEKEADQSKDLDWNKELQETMEKAEAYNASKKAKEESK